MAKKEVTKKSKQKKNTAKTTVTKDSTQSQPTTFPTTTFTVTYSNQEQYDLLKYDPATKCKAIREITTRNFEQTKIQANDSKDLGDYDSAAGIDTSGFKNSNCKKIADYLLKKELKSGGHLNGAQVVGILANIRQESNYSPSAVNEIGASGICQWLGGRATSMKKACGDQWASNLSGQVDFLWKELTSGYKSSVLDPMLNNANENTKEKAYKAMEIFCKHFEIPGNYDVEIPRRKKFVDELWKQIKFTTFQGSGKNYNLTERQIKELVAGCKAEINSTKVAIQFEASLMCNLAYKNKKNVYDYVKNSSWFASDTKSAMRNKWKKVTSEQYKWGYEVFNGGLRTAPEYIDEHDYFPNDIAWIKYNGPNDKKVYSGFSIKKLIPGKSVLRNKYKSTYTFWVAQKTSDPSHPYEPFGSKTYPVKFKS